MTKTIVYGPTGTAVEGVAAVTFAVPPLNFDEDFSLIDEGKGSIVFTDITSPTDQPSTLRIAQRPVANVYSRSSIDPSLYLATKRGTDMIIEVLETHMEHDSVDSSLDKAWPARFALTMSTPDAAQVDAASIKRGVARLVAALAAMGDATLDAGIDKLRHGVVRK